MTLMMKRVITYALAIIVVFGLTSCNKTSYEGNDNIIEASELGALLSDTNTIVIDARSSKEYDKGHLKGAINMPPAELTISDPVPGTIATKEKVEEVLSSKGISNDSKVYIYSNNGEVNATRVWWVMKVYGHDVVKVVNNGETAITNSGLELTKEVPEVATADYVAVSANADMIATMNDVIVAIDDEDVCLLDVRSQAEYDEGAILSAILYPHTKNVYTDGTFRSSRDIYLNYKDIGLDKDDAIILYCKSSFRATQTALLLGEAGYTDIKIYDGAWLEWSTKDMPQTEQDSGTTSPSTQDAS